MLSALLATALTLMPVESANALPLRTHGRTLALTAASLEVSCTSCALVPRLMLGQRKKKAEPSPQDEGFTPPPLLDSEPQTPPGGELTPPPDVPSWQAPPVGEQQQESPPPPPNQNGVKYDMNAGQIVPKEVAFGALALMLSDIVAAGIVVVAIVFAAASSVGSSNLSAFFVGIFVAAGVGLLHLLLSPLWVVLAVKASADEPTHNGLGGAALGAYGAAVGLGVLFFGLSFALSMFAVSARGSSGDGINALSSLITLFGIVVRWIGVPIAASWAMHRGPPPPMQVVAPHPRRPVLVSADGREVKPIGGATIFAF